jgi:hypothetical protein
MKTRVLWTLMSELSYLNKGTTMNRPQTPMRAWSGAALLALMLCHAPVVAGDAPTWQPMLGKSFKGDVKDLGVTGLVVYRNPGCVFLLVEDKVYCSAAGANHFKPVSETWKQICAHAKKVSDPKHVLMLSETCIKESTDGGATWLTPIALPKDFVVSSQTWVQYDATNDALYLMQKGSDLYKLARRK